MALLNLHGIFLTLKGFENNNKLYAFVIFVDNPQKARLSVAYWFYLQFGRYLHFPLDVYIIIIVIGWIFVLC